MRCVALVLGLLVGATSHVGAQPADWSVRRDPFDRALIARYKAMLVRDPHDSLALSALASLYKRHRTIELLVREYEESLAKTAAAPTLVVLGRLARNAQASERAIELYARAVATNGSDSGSWLALGELRAAHGDPADARAAFAKATETARTPAHKRRAFRKLVDATRATRDRAAMEGAFDALLALTPRDGRLWTERGDAEVELQAYDDAITSYKRAEELLARDPERKLLAIAARALAFDRAGKPSDAIDEYERALAASPRGYYLRRELAFRIIDVFRRHHSVDAALAYLARVWPTKKRSAFEWGTVAELFKERGETANMAHALHQAVKADPRDVALQWKLIRHYDSTHETVIALSLLEVAAAASPRDVSLNLELAQRLWLHAGPTRRDDDIDIMGWRSIAGQDVEPHRWRALDIARKLSIAAGRNAETHRALAEVFARFGRMDLALEEARKVATLEPSDDNFALLGDALFAAKRLDEALAIWKRISKPGTPAALQRVADIYLDHQLWDQAIDAFTEAMYGDLGNPMLWRGRAVAFAELGHLEEARIDAQHAVDLMGPVPYDKGHEIRFRLVHIMRQEAIVDALGDETIEPDLWVMQLDKDFMKAKGDVQSGYLLAEYYRRRPDESLMRVLEKLHERVPTDHGVALELIRVYRQLEKLDKALALVKWLAAADPTRAQDLAEVVAAIERDRPIVAARNEREARDAEYFGTGCIKCVYEANAYEDELPATIGLRFGVGDGLRGPASGALTIGGRLLLPVHDELALMTRIDWVRRAKMPLPPVEETTVHAIGASLGLAYPVVRSPQGTVLLGAAYRGELRLGDEMERAGFDRVGFAADATLELVPAKLPASLGLRFEQGLSDHGTASTFLVELTLELNDRSRP